MTVKVSNHLFKKRIVRNTAGNIIDLYDEADGGWIIQKGRVVNQERYNEMLQKEEDRKTAAQAIQHQKVDEAAPDRTVSGTEAIKNNTKIEELEKRIDGVDTKLDAILNALKK